MEIIKNEASGSYLTTINGERLIKIIGTSYYPEKSKEWRHDSHNLIDVMSNAILQEERNQKINDIIK